MAENKKEKQEELQNVLLKLQEEEQAEEAERAAAAKKAERKVAKKGQNAKSQSNLSQKENHTKDRNNKGNHRNNSSNQRNQSNSRHNKNHSSGRNRKKEEFSWKQELTTGISAFIVDTILLFLGVWIFSMIYKAFVTYELVHSMDALLASITYYVSPATGILGILLLFILKNVYDIRFYRIQMWAREHKRKILRLSEWILYVCMMIFFELFAFLCFSCGWDFFDTYTFESPILGNLAYTLLYIVMPFLYAIHALARLLSKHVLKEGGRS